MNSNSIKCVLFGRIRTGGAWQEAYEKQSEKLEMIRQGN